MKTRNGFVSNSSSASFVVIGYQMAELGLDKLSNEEKEKIIKESHPKMLESESYKKYGIEDVWYEYINNYCFMGIEGITCIQREGAKVVGVQIAWMDSDEGGLGSKEISLEKVLAIIKPFQDKMGISKLPKVITGTVAC
jgi:hypothetical protein